MARGGYDVFGEAVPVSGNVGQPFGFTGREHERDSGLVYVRDRYLSVAVGRWTQADRWAPLQGALEPGALIQFPDPYAYVAGNPISYVDPLGFAITSIDKAVMSMLIRGAYRELMLFLSGIGMTAMQIGRQVQDTLSKFIQAGSARILVGQASGGAAYRVPDWLDRAKGVLVELKFVNPCTLRVTSQLRDFANFARAETAAGRPTELILLVRESDKIRPWVVSNLASLGYKIIEIKDFALQQLETVKVVIE